MKDFMITSTGDIALNNYDINLIEKSYDLIKQNIFAELNTIKGDLFYRPDYGLSMIEYIHSGNEDIYDIAQILKFSLEEKDYIENVIVTIDSPNIHLDIYLIGQVDSISVVLDENYSISEV